MQPFWFDDARRVFSRLKLSEVVGLVTVLACEYSSDWGAFERNVLS